MDVDIQKLRQEKIDEDIIQKLIEIRKTGIAEENKEEKEIEKRGRLTKTGRKSTHRYSYKS